MVFLDVRNFKLFIYCVRSVYRSGVKSIRSNIMSSKIPQNSSKQHIPFAKGPYAVGCVDIMTGHDTEGNFMRLFYPAAYSDTLAHSDDWPSWLPSDEYIEGYGKYFGYWMTLFRPLFRYFAGPVYVPVLNHAPPSKEGTFPVMVFSHGLSACRTTYSSICYQIASYGFIVAAVEHRDNSACMSYCLKSQDGNTEVEWQPIQKLSELRKVMEEEREEVIRNKQVHQRSKECQRTLDLLHQVNNGDKVENVLDDKFSLADFKGRLNLDNPIIAGHSFGGSTAMVTLAEDSRFRIGISLDIWLVPLKLEEGLGHRVEQPVLFICTEWFQTQASNLHIMKEFEKSEGSHRSIITIKGSSHMNQTDIPFFLPSMLRWFAGVSSYIEHEVAMEINNCLMICFILKHLGLPKNSEIEKYLEDHQKYLETGLNHITQKL